jgi:hypothetical protein
MTHTVSTATFITHLCCYMIYTDDIAAFITWLIQLVLLLSCHKLMKYDKFIARHSWYSWFYIVNISWLTLLVQLSTQRYSYMTQIVVTFSVAEPEPHLLAGAGAVTRCGSGFGSDGSGSDGSGSDNGIKHG